MAREVSWKAADGRGSEEEYRPILGGKNKGEAERARDQEAKGEGYR